MHVSNRVHDLCEILVVENVMTPKSEDWRPRVREYLIGNDQPDTLQDMQDLVPSVIKSLNSVTVGIGRKEVFLQSCATNGNSLKLVQGLLRKVLLMITVKGLGL